MIPRSKWYSFLLSFRFLMASAVLALVVVIGWLINEEVRTSEYQARFFSHLAGKANYALDTGPSPSIRFPRSAPFDDRLGYAQLPMFLDKLKSREFAIVKQARISDDMAKIVDSGYFAPYA
jgi:hypothetical protein